MTSSQRVIWARNDRRKATPSASVSSASLAAAALSSHDSCVVGGTRKPGP